MLDQLAYVHLEKWNCEACLLSMISDTATLPENIMNLIYMYLSTMLLSGRWRSSLHCYNNLTHNTQHFPVQHYHQFLSLNTIHQHSRSPAKGTASTVHASTVLPHKTHSTILSKIQCLFIHRWGDGYWEQSGNELVSTTIVGSSMCVYTG